MTEHEFREGLRAAEKHPAKIALAVSGLPEKVLLYKPSPGKWCIHEILGHLADMEVLYAYRMRQILADKNPVFASIDQDDWARNLGYTQEPVAELLAQLGLMRRATVRLLQRVPFKDLQKDALHPELNRRMILEEWVERLFKHGPNHLEQIERLKKGAKK